MIAEFNSQTPERCYFRPIVKLSRHMIHVFREQDAARREGREIVSQSVQIHTAVCPECGRVYVSGGKTTTVSREKTGFNPDDQKRIGKLMDAYA
jgi:hypothetical protein